MTDAAGPPCLPIWLELARRRLTGRRGAERLGLSPYRLTRLKARSVPWRWEEAHRVAAWLDQPYDTLFRDEWVLEEGRRRAWAPRPARRKRGPPRGDAA